MCEATAYLLKDDHEELLLEGVDLIEPDADGNIKLVSIFGEQKVVQARIKKMALVDHKILLEPA
jgi:predicted RNA-binding protein